MTPPEKTILTLGDALDALSDAHNSEVGGDPSPDCLLITASHTAFETRLFTMMYNYNFANIRGEANGLWTSFPTKEIVDGKEIVLAPGSGNKFRAYLGRVAGARDYWAVLQEDWQEAFLACEAGNLDEFVQGLHSGGKYGPFFTAGFDRYLSGVHHYKTVIEESPEWKAWGGPRAV